MVSADKAVNLVVALLVVGLLTAFLAPVAIGAISGPEDTTVTQATGETVELQPGLNATLDSVDTTADTASYTVTAGGDSATATVDLNTNSTVTVDGADVTIEPTAINTGNATTSYEYPTTYGWGSGAGALWSIIPVLIVLAIFLYITYLAINQY